MREIATKNFLRWNQALKTGRPEEVARLYSKESTFLPTFSNQFKKGPKEVKSYFEEFLKKNPEGKITEEKVQVLSEKIYSHSGFYVFSVRDEKVKKKVKARFTFIWRKKSNGDWEIIHHHSSPRMP